MKYKNEIFNVIKSKTKKPFDENTVIRDLDLDSIDMVEMIADFEDNFKINIPSSEIQNIKTIKDLLDLIEKVS